MMKNLLKYIYSLGFASSEIKRVFTDFSTKFTNYHALNSDGSLDLISNDVTNVYKKLVTITLRCFKAVTIRSFMR